MRKASLPISALALALLCGALNAADWPQWRGPNRDGVAPDSPALVSEFPKEGPKMLWRSEPIPGGENGGFAQPVVADGKVFVFYNCRFDVPLVKRLLTRDALSQLGWAKDMPGEMTTLMEAARTGEERAKLKDGGEIGKWADGWLKANMKPDWRRFQGAVKTRLVMGPQALPLEILARLDNIADKEFAGQGEFDAWMKQQGITPPQEAEVMKKIPTTVRACNDVLFCLDRETGNTVWKKEVPGNWMWYAASSTPTVSGGRVYLLGSGAVAHCFNAADGNQIWESKPLGAAQHTHNRSSSILLADGKAIFGTDTGTYALDAATGEMLWKAVDEKGQAVVNKEASGVVCKYGGRTLVIYPSINGGGKICGLDPATGKALWSVPAGSTAVTPAMAGDIVAVCSWTSEVGVSAWRLTAEEPKKLWSVPIKEGYACPVIYKGCVFAVGGGNATSGENGKGRAVCVEVETGKVAWSEMLGGGAELSSPIAADGKLIVQVASALYLIKASPEKYELLGKVELGLAKWTSPAFSDGRLFVRSRERVVCYDLRKQ